MTIVSSTWRPNREHGGRPDQVERRRKGSGRDLLVPQPGVAVCTVHAGCEFSKIAEKMQKVQFPADALIITQGEIGSTFYLISKGSVEVSQQRDGEPGKTIARLGVGDFFGERALMTDEPRNATIVAREETETYTLTKADFTAAMSATVH